MKPPPDETIEAAIQVIGTSGIQEVEIESRVRELVDDDMTARRLIDWIAEAFGLVYVAHLSPKAILPDYFLAKDHTGRFVTLKLGVEPIVAPTVRIAQRMLHEGPKEVFENVAFRSSISNTVSNALNSGASLDGACFSGPALLGIPADIYPTPPKSFWQRIFSR